MKLDKKKLIVIIICAVIIIAAVIVAICSGKKSKTYTLSGEGMPTEASYCQNGKNLKFYFGLPEDSNFKWIASTNYEDCIEIKDKSGSGKKVFEVSAKEKAFAATVEFILQNPDDSDDSSYKVTVSVISDLDKKLSVQNVEYSVVEGAVTGDLSGLSYKLYGYGDGEYKLTVENGSLDEFYWKTDYEGDLLDICGPAYGEEYVSFIIYVKDHSDEEEQKEYSGDTVIFYSDELKVQLTVQFSVGEDNILHLVSHTPGTYETKKVLDEEEEKNFIDKYGSVKLPADALKISYGTRHINVSSEDETGMECASVEFYFSEKKCRIIFSDSVSSEDAFMWRYTDMEGLISNVEKISGIDVTVNYLDGYVIATWTDNGTVYIFFGQNMTVDMAEQILKEIV